MAFKVEGEARVAFTNAPGQIPQPPDNGEIKVQQADALLVTRQADGTSRFTDLRPMTEQLATGPLAAALEAKSTNADNLFSLTDKAAARGNLELGTAAVQDLGSFGWRIATFDGASTADIPAPVIAAYVEDRGARYKRVASEPAHPLKFNNGGWWEIDERQFFVDMAGAVPDGVTDSSAAFQRAADYARAKKIGRVYLRDGIYRAAGVRYGFFTIWTAFNRGCSIIKVPDGANTFCMKSDGFDDWADSVPSVTAPVNNFRGYRWHSSPTARNGVGYVMNDIVVTRITDPGRDGSWGQGERWWQAVSVNPDTGKADRNSDWVEKSPLIGAICSGFDGLKFDGNAAAQNAPYMGLCHYGIGPTLSDIYIANFGDWGLWWEVPGNTFSSQVGVPLQAVWRDVRAFDCGTATSGNIMDNGQSDTTRFYTMSWQPKNKGVMHYLGEKAGGGRHYGFHYWCDDASTNPDWNWGLFSWAASSDWSGHAEARVWLSGARHAGDFKIYKGSSTGRVVGAAVWLSGVSDSKLRVRSYLFRNCFRFVGSDGGRNELSGTLFESAAGTAVIDSTGAAPASSTKITAQNSVNTDDMYELSGPQRLGRRPGAITRPVYADYDDRTTGWSFSSQGLQRVVGGVERALTTSSEEIMRLPIRAASYTTTTLPVANSGALIWVSDARDVGEAAGSGTGCIAVRKGGTWRRLADNTVVAA